MAADNEWYVDGLSFRCTMCGNCCSGAPGVVWFEEKEGLAMAEKLQITEARFYKIFARKVGGRWSLKERMTPHGLDCVFLDRETSPGKALCRVYGARPVQCRTWPFWPENLESPEAWQRAGADCPGLNKGGIIPVTQIRILRDKTPDE